MNVVMYVTYVCMYEHINVWVSMQVQFLNKGKGGLEEGRRWSKGRIENGLKKVEDGLEEGWRRSWKGVRNVLKKAEDGLEKGLIMLLKNIENGLKEG